MDNMGDEQATDTGEASKSLLTVTPSIVGKKWHPHIVAALLQGGPLGFNDLKDRVDGISDKVLSESLEDLQEHTIVDRTVIDDKPVRVEYSLTEWGDRYLAALEEADSDTEE